MGKVATKQGLEVASVQVKARKGEVVHVRVHLVSRPDEVHEVEEGIEACNEVAHVLVWDFFQKPVQFFVDFVVEVPSSQMVEHLLLLGLHSLQMGQFLEAPC